VVSTAENAENAEGGRAREADKQEGFADFESRHRARQPRKPLWIRVGAVVMNALRDLGVSAVKRMSLIRVSETMNAALGVLCVLCGERMASDGTETA
jgi:hypothetical protein